MHTKRDKRARAFAGHGPLVPAACKKAQNANDASLIEHAPAQYLARDRLSSGPTGFGQSEHVLVFVKKANIVGSLRLAPRAAVILQCGPSHRQRRERVVHSPAVYLHLPIVYALRPLGRAAGVPVPAHIEVQDRAGWGVRKRLDGPLACGASWAPLSIHLVCERRALVVARPLRLHQLLEVVARRARHGDSMVPATRSPRPRPAASASSLRQAR
eukprot:scaffold1265_cov366-Prasinococcus_capsulatus_cf.AAC.16